MFNLKDAKIVKELKSIKPKLKWLMFSQIQDYKINSKYIDIICADDKKESADAKLEAMVRETLIKEFTPEITKEILRVFGGRGDAQFEKETARCC